MKNGSESSGVTEETPEKREAATAGDERVCDLKRVSAGILRARKLVETRNGLKSKVPL